MIVLPREGQSVYSEWFNYVMKPQIKVFEENVNELMNLPNDPDYITKQDIRSLVKRAHYFDVTVDDYDLKDSKQFYMALGDIEKAIKKTVMKDLQPQDPDLEFYKQKFGDGQEDQEIEEKLEEKEKRIKNLEKQLEGDD